MQKKIDYCFSLCIPAYGLRYHEYVVYPASTGPLPIRIPGVHHCPAFVLAGARYHILPIIIIIIIIIIF